MNEISRARTEPVPDKEFLEKKRSLIASYALSLETPSTILSNYIASRRDGLPADYWDRRPVSEKMTIIKILRDQIPQNRIFGKLGIGLQSAAFGGCDTP